MNAMPKCTHCGYKFDSDDTFHSSCSVGDVFTGDGEFSDLKCPYCGHTFHVLCSHAMDFINVNSDYEEL